MEDGYTNFTLRMKKDDRDNWKEMVEYSDQFNSLSQLVRYSVNQEIRRIEDRQEGEMTKEEREVIDRIKAEHGRTRDILSEIQDLAEELQQTTLTASEAEVMAQNQTHNIVDMLEEGENNE